MKKIIATVLAAGLMAGVFFLFSPAASAQGAQGQKIKEKAKDLKKKVEGNQAATNAPPQKPKPR